LERRRQIVLDIERGVNQGVDRLFLRSLDWLQTLSAAPVASQATKIGIKKLSFEEVAKQG
jgi:hypothetical protein